MCKRNSYLFFFALFLSIVISICVSNRYLLYFLSILFLSTSVGKKHLKIAYLSFYIWCVIGLFLFLNYLIYRL